MISLLCVIAGFVLLAVFWSFGVQHWIAWYTGGYNCPKAGCPGGSPHDYNFWSGFGSDIGEYVVATSFLGAAITVWRTNTCHLHWWCWRRPLHPVADSPYKVCHVHHPDDVMTVQEAVDAASAK